MKNYRLLLLFCYSIISSGPLFAQKTGVATYFNPDSSALIKVDSIYNSLTTKQRLGQMIVVAGRRVWTSG